MPLDLDRFDALVAADAVHRQHPAVAANILMEDFYYAGGLRGVADRDCAICCNVDCLTVNGRTLGENIDGAVVCNDDVITPREQPLGAEGGVAVLRGNLAPDGAVIKHTAAEPRLLQHAGPAVVFEDYNDLETRASTIRRCPVTADSVLVLQNAGPLGGPGMPEWGMLPIPKKLLEQGVRDMVRISDARMSGTSYGACVLHVAPESFVGGPLAFVRDGDIIELDVPARRLSLRVSDEELARRRAALEAARGRLPARLRPPLRASRHAGRTEGATSISWRARRRSPIPRFTDRARPAPWQMRHRVFYCVLPEDSGMTRTHRIGGVCALALSLLGLPLTTPPAAADPIPIVTVTSGSAILDPLGLGSEFDLHGTEGFSFVGESDDNSGVCSPCAEGETHDFSVRAVATFLATATFQGQEYVFDFNNGGGIFSFQTGSVIMPGQPGTSGTTRFTMPFSLGSESFLRFESNPPFLVALAGSGTLTFLANFTNIPEIGTVLLAQ